MQENKSPARSTMAVRGFFVGFASTDYFAMTTARLMQGRLFLDP